MGNETYCGKSCAECTDQETLNCPGCKQGPGGTFAKCAIARCCRDKRHDTCGTCTSWSYCGLRGGRDQEPALRLKKQAEEERQQQQDRANAPVVTRWINVLFWLFIPQVIAGLMIQDNVVKELPFLLMPGTLLNIVCLVIYGVALWRMQEIHGGYRNAAICNLVGAAGCLLGLSPLKGVLMLLIDLALAVVNLVAIYLEYTTHSEVLALTSMVLAQQWRQLWTWNLWCIAGVVISFILLFILPRFAMLAMVALYIASVVLAVLKLVYLRRMYWHFRQYC